MIDRPSFWIVTILLGAATYGIRLSFLAWSQNRVFSDRVKTLLDFVPVTVLPALIAPLIFYPAATEGSFDLARVLAAVVALGVGLWARNVLAVIASGIAALSLFQYLIA